MDMNNAGRAPQSTPLGKRVSFCVRCAALLWTGPCWVGGEGKVREEGAAGGWSCAMVEQSRERHVLKALVAAGAFGVAVCRLQS